MSTYGVIMGYEESEHGTERGECDSAIWWDFASKGMDIAEIRITMSLKAVNEQILERLLETNSAQRLEELDVLTLRNFLHYLRSL